MIKKNYIQKQAPQQMFPEDAGSRSILGGLLLDLVRQPTCFVLQARYVLKANNEMARLIGVNALKPVKSAELLVANGQLGKSAYSMIGLSPIQVKPNLKQELSDDSISSGCHLQMGVDIQVVSLAPATADGPCFSQVNTQHADVDDSIITETAGFTNAQVHGSVQQPNSFLNASFLGCAELARDCILSGDIYQSVESAVAAEKLSEYSHFVFLLELSDQLFEAGDRITALSYLNEARRLFGCSHVDGLSAIVSRLIKLGQNNEAQKVFVQAALDGVGILTLSEGEKLSIRQSNANLHRLVDQKLVHGQDLILANLKANFEQGALNIDGRSPVLVEIGSTREDVPGQGSTRQLAEYCKANSIDFITVDMDSRNSETARRLFCELDAPNFLAITAKGEDYLRQYSGSMDYVFLDAYDFDHGQHSELRQSRYVKFLGARIDDVECHKMHLDCAQSIAKKISKNGLVCFDDTWLENGKWTAKGTLGMPYLLDNGFELVDVRNRAALLRSKYGVQANP